MKKRLLLIVGIVVIVLLVAVIIWYQPIRKYMSRSRIPVAVREMYDKAPEHDRVFLDLCVQGGIRVYKLTVSNGFAGRSTYYDAGGKELGGSVISDFQPPHAPKPTFDITNFTCTTLLQRQAEY